MTIINQKSKPTFEIEQNFGDSFVIGIDEAGLGPWAGPLVVAATHIPTKLLPDSLSEIDDSKRLSKNKREELFERITQSNDIMYSIQIISPERIDEISLGAAWKEGIINAAKDLNLPNETVCLLDGNKMVNIPQHTTVCVTKGDQKSISIAAASIIAKVTRDRIMMQIHNESPEYGFNTHVGYGTKKHSDAIKQYGITRHHRKSYKPIIHLINC